MIQSEKNLSIAPFTHYKIGGIAKEVYFPTDASELLELFGEFAKNGTDFYILGGGSNVLVGDGYFDGAVIITTHMNHFEPLQDQEIDFEYKYNSISKEGWLICEASLTWAYGDPAIIKKSMDDIQKNRTR